MNATNPHDANQLVENGLTKTFRMKTVSWTLALKDGTALFGVYKLG